MMRVQFAAEWKLARQPCRRLMGGPRFCAAAKRDAA